MRRQKRKSAEPAVRLPEDVTDVLNRLVETTGWSGSTALSFLARAGANAVMGKGDKIAGYQKFLEASIDLREAETAAKKKLSVATAKLTEARKAITPTKERR